jgi:hypothetical protein
MQQITQFLIGILVLILGFPIGNFLAKQTKEELKSGQKWFKIILSISLVGAIISLFVKDILLFSFLFIFIITSRSLIRKD